MESLRIQQNRISQYTVTVPKKLCVALGITKGTRVIWKLGGASKLELYILRDKPQQE